MESVAVLVDQPRQGDGGAGGEVLLWKRCPMVSNLWTCETDDGIEAARSLPQTMKRGLCTRGPPILNGAAATASNYGTTGSVVGRSSCTWRHPTHPAHALAIAWSDSHNEWIGDGGQVRADLSSSKKLLLVP